MVCNVPLHSCASVPVLMLWLIPPVSVLLPVTLAPMLGLISLCVVPFTVVLTLCQMFVSLLVCVLVLLPVVPVSQVLRAVASVGEAQKHAKYGKLPEKSNGEFEVKFTGPDGTTQERR